MNIFKRVMFLVIYFYTINHGDGLVYGNFNSDQDRFNTGIEELRIC